MVKIVSVLNSIAIILISIVLVRFNNELKGNNQVLNIVASSCVDKVEASLAKVSTDLKSSTDFEAARLTDYNNQLKGFKASLDGQSARLDSFQTDYNNQLKAFKASLESFKPEKPKLVPKVLEPVKTCPNCKYK